MEIVPIEQISLKGVRGVLVDLDDTLYSYQEAHKLALVKCYEYCTEFLSGISLEEFSANYRLGRDQVTEKFSPLPACRSRLLAFQIFFEKSNISKAYLYAMKAEEVYWDTLIKSAFVFPKALEFLQECKKLGIKTCLVSDMSMAIQVKKLISLGLIEYIDFVVTSEEVGVEKPDPKMFQAGLEKLKCRESELIMLGDNTSKDIIGANKLGIKSYKVN